MVDVISPAELRDGLDRGDEFTLVDTRDDQSFQSWRIPGAVQYPFKPGQEFDAEEFQTATGADPDDRIVTICAKGISSFEFTEKLEAAGYDDVTVVEDGMEGWSAVYDVVDVPTDGSVAIVQVQRRAKGCLSYLLADPESGTTAVVDPTRHVDRFATVAAERGYDVDAVLDTHVHADHISGGRELADDLDATYYLSADAAGRDVSYDYEPLDQNEVVTVGSVEVKALKTPGHTSGAVSYLVDGTAVMTGDTLFVDSVGRTELQFGDSDAEHGARLLYRSIHDTLLAEPEAVCVLPGHFPVASDGTTPVTHGEPVETTVRAARTGLALLGLDEDQFVAEITESLPTRPANYEDVVAINTGRRRPSDEAEARSLEVGPNNCAATSD